MDSSNQVGPFRLAQGDLPPQVVQDLEGREGPGLPPGDEAQGGQERGHGQSHPSGARQPRHAAFLQALRRALRARGFLSISVPKGLRGPLNTGAPSDLPRHLQTGSPGGQTQARLHSRKASFTIRSSREW